MGIHRYLRILCILPPALHKAVLRLQSSNISQRVEVGLPLFLRLWEILPRRRASSRASAHGTRSISHPSHTIRARRFYL